MVILMLWFLCLCLISAEDTCSSTTASSSCSAESESNFIRLWEWVRTLHPSTQILIILGLLLIIHLVQRLVAPIIYNPRGILAGITEMVEGARSVVPGLGSALDAEAEKVLEKMKHKYANSVLYQRDLKEMPIEGTGPEDIRQQLNDFLTEHGDQSYRHGKCSGGLYMPEDGEHLEVCGHAMSLYCDTNALHLDCFPAVNFFERSIINITKSLLGGANDPDIVGIVSTGGTESILLSVLAHRDYGYKTKGIKKPNIVVPRTIHVAFEKGCHLFGLEIKKASVNPNTWQVDLDDYRRLIDSNTVLLAASAPSYPHGIIDPIEEIAAIGLARNIPFHVDSCLGGYYLPFLRMYQERTSGASDLPPFDFSVEGVTAMSADTHKFGQAPKGTSVVLFRGKDRRNCAFYHSFDWSGGHYGSQTLLGSRSGAPIAACWASLIHNGLDRFVELTGQIQEEMEIVRAKVEELDGLKVMGDPKAMLTAFQTTVKGISPYQLLDEMKTRGWKLQGLQVPPSFHVMFNAKHIGMGAEMAKDLEEAWATVRSNPDCHLEGTAALYGTSLVAPTGVLSQVASGILGFILDGVDVEGEEKKEV